MNKSTYELDFFDYADDSHATIEAKSLKELKGEIQRIIEEQSREILDLWNENIKLKAKIRKKKSK